MHPAVLLFHRKFQELRNLWRHSARGWLLKRFFLVSLSGGLMALLYAGFVRLLHYLQGTAWIGPLLVWKLTAIAHLTLFSMIAISSLIAALTTLYYSEDLLFLLLSPTRIRWIFLEKVLATVFYASWMVVLAEVPYLAALGHVKGLGPSFYLSAMGLLAPFLFLSAFLGILLTLFLMAAFPSSKTRNVVWVLSSLFMAALYVLLRLVQPEKLIRPDVLVQAVGYIQYLEAPTALYLPSWWITRALMAWTSGDFNLFLKIGLMLWALALALYGLLVLLAERIYLPGFWGAQEGSRRSLFKGVRFSHAWLPGWEVLRKDVWIFFRDVRQWSQLILVLALVVVYLFSVYRLPLDTPYLKSMIAFVNIGIAGFVLASLGLRFVFPCFSLEGRSFWILQSAPVPMRKVLMEKFVLSALPMCLVGSVLVWWSNRLLQADRFVSVLTLVTVVVFAWDLSVMAVSLGVLFPKLNVDNIHQIESSLGGFIYMALALAYVGISLSIMAWPMGMYFYSILGRINAWNVPALVFCGVCWLGLHVSAAWFPWRLALKAIDRIEV